MDEFEAETVIVAALERTAAEQAAWLRTDLSRHVAALLPPGAATSAEDLTRVVDDLTDQAAGRYPEEICAGSTATASPCATLVIAAL